MSRARAGRQCAASLLLLVSVATLPACPSALADAPPATAARLWSGGDLDALTAALAKTGAAYTQVLRGGSYGALVLRRAVSGDPELHVRLNDFFIILGGEGEIRVGGTATGVRTFAPDERRAERLVGGARYRLRRGDLLFVPANHWLQVLVSKGRVLRAVIIKTR